MPLQKIREYNIMKGPFNGTYGQVYVVQHGTIGWTRAIKLLHSFVLEDIIEEEAKKQRAVKSPYVVQIFDFYEGPKAILMEYCPLGFDKYLVDRFSQTKDKLPYDEARERLHGILQGLNDAHKAGVIHGDIKPANILLGTDDLPKLGDFGAARRLRQTSPVLRGSTNWMAPEVLEGGQATKESDYFSYGVLAYLVFSGRHPFFAEDPSCLTSEDDNIKSLTFRPTPLSSLRPDIPPLVAALVMELLSRDVEIRMKAEESLKAALSQPFEPERELVTPSIHEQPTPKEIAQLEAAYDNAREQFFRYFRPREALEIIEKFLAEFQWERFEGQGITRLADCWSLKAYINNSGGLFQEAIEAATNGLRVDENHVSSLHARGYAYIQIGDNIKAVQDLQRALDQTTDPRKRTQIGRLLDTLKARQPA